MFKNICKWLKLHDVFIRRKYYEKRLFFIPKFQYHTTDFYLEIPVFFSDRQTIYNYFNFIYRLET